MDYTEEVQLENLLRRFMRDNDAEMYNRIRRMYQATSAHTSISFVEFVLVSACEGRKLAFDAFVGE